MNPALRQVALRRGHGLGRSYGLDVVDSVQGPVVVRVATAIGRSLWCPGGSAADPPGHALLATREHDARIGRDEGEH